MKLVEPFLENPNIQKEADILIKRDSQTKRIGEQQRSVL
jgi:hypothetical protein